MEYVWKSSLWIGIFKFLKENPNPNPTDLIIYSFTFCCVLMLLICCQVKFKKKLPNARCERTSPEGRRIWKAKLSEREKKKIQEVKLKYHVTRSMWTVAYWSRKRKSSLMSCQVEVWSTVTNLKIQTPVICIHLSMEHSVLGKRQFPFQEKH